MVYLAINDAGDAGVVYVACKQEVKGLSFTGELDTFRFPYPHAAKDEAAEECEHGLPEKDDSQSGRVLGLCVSRSGRLVAALSDRKTACVWRSADGGVLGSWQTVRKASCLTFTRDEQALLVADKSGDVYRCTQNTPGEKPELILGHISMVLDMLVTRDGRRLVTCDRDEKIRVTRYPSTWSIDAYCLGHSEFVSTLCLTPTDRLVSGGGDMTVRLWDHKTGAQLASAAVAIDGDDSSNCAQKVAVTAVVAVTGEADCLLVVQVHSWSRLPVLAVAGDCLSARPALQLDWVPWAVAAAGSRLYVLGPGPSSPLAVYTTSGDGGRLRLLPTSPLTAAAASLYPQLQGSFELEAVDWLFKQWFDNVSGYLSRKQDRLDGQKKDAEENAAGNVSERPVLAEEHLSKKPRTSPE